MSHNFNEIAQLLRPVATRASQVREGDWLDTRCDPKCDPSDRAVAYIFANAEDFSRWSVVLHREGMRALTVAHDRPVTVWRPINACSPPLHCELTCQCSQWHAECKRRATVTAEDRLREQVKSLQEELILRTYERDDLRKQVRRLRNRLDSVRNVVMGS